MSKIELVRTSCFLTCANCNECVDRCDNCGEVFKELFDDVYCDEDSLRHYCKDCAKEFEEESDSNGNNKS